VNGSARAVALLAAILSLSAVILAAMGSHLIDMKGMQDLWQTASAIHLFSAAALVGLAALLANLDSRLLKWGTWLIIFGTVVFCGSIYYHVISGHKVPAVTPVGGFLMMVGWFLAALAFFRKP
jgi:uncharacterized membrane protein YgdD (TMEM256/DUF423 family)